MAVTVRCTGFFRAEDGHAYLNWDDGNQSEFSSEHDLADYGNGIDAMTQGDLARRIHARWWRQRDPNGTDTSLIVGKELTFDMATAEMIKVT